MQTIRWGLIGAGDIVKKRVAAALCAARSSELAAVARARPELAEAFAHSCGAKRWFSSWSDLVRDPDIDAVYIATPPGLHAGQAIAAACAGKHVLCEKPMAMNVAECDRMIAACRANNVLLGVAYYRRFYPIVARIKEIISSGEIGAVTIAQVNAFEWFDPPPDHPRRWLIERRAGGGPMFDFGCHRIEVLIHFFGPVKHITGVLSNNAFRREVEDTALAHIQFESGVIASLAVTHASAESLDTLDVFGTRGAIHAPLLNKGELFVRSQGGARVELHPPAENLHQPLVEDFVQAILDKRPPAATGETGRAVAAVEEIVYASALSAGADRPSAD